MKRVFFALALVAFSLGMSAQHVNPLNIKLAEFNLDSMRTQYVNQTEMYSTELQHIVLLQDADTKAIKEAWKELKDEKAHAKNVAACLKEVNSSVNNLEKSAQKEIDVIKNMIKTIEKQQKSLRELKKLSVDTRDAYNDYLVGEKQYLDNMLDELTARQKNLSDALNGAQSLQTSLDAYNLEIQQKELDLKQLEATCKARVETIKAEQKIVKAMLKNK
jgi:chromosome segregation ATPase